MGDKVAPYGIGALVGQSPPMRQYKVDTPGHGTITIEGPEGASDEQLIEVAQNEIASRFPREKFAQPQVKRFPGAPVQSGGAVDSFVRGASNGLTAGLGDHISAMANAVLPLDKLTGRDVSSLWDGSSLMDAYHKNLGQEHATDAVDAQEHPIVSGIGQIGGAVASPLSRLIGGGGVARGILNSAIYGGVYGGAQADQGQEDANASGGAVTGALGDIAGRAVFGGLGRIAAPVTSAAVRTLRNAGVPLTMGQTLGGVARSLEDKAMSVPGLGDLIRYQRRQGVEGFNRAAVNEALGPIGAQLPADTGVGRDAARYGQERVSQAYGDALRGLSLQPDAQITTQLQAAHTLSRTLPPAQRQVFDNAMQREVAPFMQGHALDGRQIQSLKQGLDAVIADYSGHGVLPSDRLVRQPLSDVRDAIMQGAERQTPDAFTDYSNADAAYSRMARINDATARVKADGVFQPQTFAGAVTRRGYGTTTPRVARGDALMQQLADAASEVLPSSVPNSGTTDRAMLAAVAGGGLGYVSPPAAALAGATAIPYLPGISRLVEAAIAGERPASVQSAGNALRRIAPVAGAIGGRIGVRRAEGR